MSIEEDFAAAQANIKNLSKAPGTDKLLELYALYKQGSGGDVAGKRPGMLDVKGRAKYDAWAKQKGKSQEDAKASYVKLVGDLIGQDS